MLYCAGIAIIARSYCYPLCHLEQAQKLMMQYYSYVLCMGGIRIGYSTTTRAVWVILLEHEGRRPEGESNINHTARKVVV